LLPQVQLLVSAAVSRVEVEINSSSARIYADRFGGEAATLIPLIRRSLPTARKAEQVDLFVAIRSIGDADQALVDVITDACNDSDEIIAIHAASTLAKLSPDARIARDRLIGFLGSPRAGTQWRAANAIGATGVSDPRWIRRLNDLLDHEDVRVRVTSAFAIWKLNRDSRIALPVLVEALHQGDQPLPTGYVYPSNPGTPHRVYAARAIGNMGVGGIAAIDELVDLVEEASRDPNAYSEHAALIGFSALDAISKLRPIPEQSADRLVELLTSGDTVFATFRERTKSLIPDLQRK